MPDGMRTLEDGFVKLAECLAALKNFHASDPDAAEEVARLCNAEEMAKRAIELIRQSRQAVDGT